MKKNSHLVLALILVVSSFTLVCEDKGAREEIALWPEIEPFETDLLQVSDIHQIYYELSGNPKGKPVFVLHGGPGSESSPFMRRFCDPDKFLIVLHDQRGCGKSTPYAELEENTTQDLVEDIERLRKHLEAGQIIILGGSWGATLALAYAETYPENVSGMVLRGVFCCTQEEMDHYYHGGTRKFFPETYDKLLAMLPDPDRRPLPNYFVELFESADSAERMRLSNAWVKYEVKIASLEVSDAWLDSVFGDEGAEEGFSMSLLENYYLANGCFMEERQLLRDLDRIAHIPTTFVNGRYDMICPPITAYRLHQRLPKSKLVIAEAAGHWMGDEGVRDALLAAMREFE
jgi:proline iminopeptidase